MTILILSIVQVTLYGVYCRITSHVFHYGRLSFNLFYHLLILMELSFLLLQCSCFYLMLFFHGLKFNFTNLFAN